MPLRKLKTQCQILRKSDEAATKASVSLVKSIFSDLMCEMTFSNFLKKFSLVNIY